MRLRVSCLAVGMAAALLSGGIAHGDPDQDQRFLTMLDQQRPAGQNVGELVGTAHRVCEKLGAGMSFAELRDRMVNSASRGGPGAHPPPSDMAALAGRFITAAVTVYCPQEQGKLP